MADGQQRIPKETTTRRSHKAVPREWGSAQEAAQHLGFSVKKVHRLRKSKTHPLPARYVPGANGVRGSWRFKFKDLDTWMDENPTAAEDDGRSVWRPPRPRVAGPGEPGFRGERIHDPPWSPVWNEQWLTTLDEKTRNWITRRRTAPPDCPDPAARLAELSRDPATAAHVAQLLEQFNRAWAARG